MLRNRAYEGQAYAWGREDSSGIRTACTMEHPTGSYAFGLAYALAYDLYNQELLAHMTNIRDAYNTWQATNGETIWSDEHDHKCYQTALAIHNED